MWKTKERTPTRCIISDYMTTTMESSNNTYPDELDTSRWGSLLINLNNIQCVRCKKCVSSLIYWVIENKNCSPDDTWPGQWPWIKFRFIISYLIIFVWNCNADQYCSWVCKNVQNGFPNNMHSLFSVAALWARWWRGPRPGCRPTGSASPRSASRRSCTAGTTSPPPPCMRRTGRTSKVSCEPSV